MQSISIISGPSAEVSCRGVCTVDVKSLGTPSSSSDVILNLAGHVTTPINRDASAEEVRIITKRYGDNNSI